MLLAVCVPAIAISVNRMWLGRRPLFAAEAASALAKEKPLESGLCVWWMERDALCYVPRP